MRKGEEEARGGREEERERMRGRRSNEGKERRKVQGRVTLVARLPGDVT